jgi:electron transfer flavoprotein alpha subunit
VAADKQREIWVLPEICGRPEEIIKISCGLLSEAISIAKKTGCAVTALVLGDRIGDYSDVLRQYGVSKAYVFQDPLLQHYAVDTYAAALLKNLREEKPWLFLLGDTLIGRELGPKLAVLLETGLVPDCVRIDLDNKEKPKFFRPVYGGQAYQEVVFQTDNTMLVTINTAALNLVTSPLNEEVSITVIQPKLSPEDTRVKHLEFLPVDFMTMDVADADTIVAAGMGAITDDLLPMVEELAGLVKGTIGATRPVADEGKISRERMIGQTGKVVSPDFYMALGISGASHHVGGIQDSGTIVSVNRDPQAPIFQSSDTGVIADLRDVLPKLIDKINQAREDGKIL